MNHSQSRLGALRVVTPSLVTSCPWVIIEFGIHRAAQTSLHLYVFRQIHLVLYYIIVYLIQFQVESSMELCGSELVKPWSLQFTKRIQRIQTLNIYLFWNLRAFD